MRRFQREAEVIARLRSPHTVELFDFGMADDGAFYYVMELLEGLDADSLVRRFGPIPAERAIYLLRQVCHSLSEAQSCGLVHRDIKPANIYLCRYGEEYDFVKVLDFGIVGAVRDTPGGNVTRTGENAVRGTPAFIAPEQVTGGEVDGRADIYATGCLAYWFLTGRTGVHRRHPDGTAAEARAGSTHAAVIPDRSADSCRAGGPGDVLPSQGPRAAAAVRQRAVFPPGPARGGGRVDRGSGAGLVADPHAGESGGTAGYKGVVADHRIEVLFRALRPSATAKRSVAGSADPSS